MDGQVHGQKAKFGKTLVFLDKEIEVFGTIVAYGPSTFDVRVQFVEVGYEIFGFCFGFEQSDNIVDVALIVQLQLHDDA
jgi:hypothetical protein